MKRISTKIWGFIIALALVATLVPSVSGVKADSVAAASGVCKIGTTEYTSLQAAFEAAPAETETTITVTADMLGTASGILTDELGKKIVLDLAGHKLASFNGAVLQIGTGNTVTIKGAGQIASMGVTTVVNSGKLVVGEVGKDDMNESPAIAGINYATSDVCVIDNKDNADYTMNSGVVTSMTMQGYDVDSLTVSDKGVAIKNQEKVTFNGGTVTHPIHFIITSNNESVEINNIVFENIIMVTTVSDSLTIKDKIVINGGAFRQDPNASTDPKKAIVFKTTTDPQNPLVPLLPFADNVTLATGGVWAKSGDYNFFHVHNVEAVPAKEATDYEDGCEAHWTCKGCGKLYSDQAGTTEVTEDKVIKPAHYNVISESATIDDSVVEKVLKTEEDEVYTLDLTNENLKDVTCVRIPVSGVSKIVAASEDPVLKIDFASGLVAGFDLEAMKAMVAKCGEDRTAYVAIDISERKVNELNEAQQKALTGADLVGVVSGTVSCGDAELSDFGEGAAVILFPFEAEANPDYDLAGYYVAEDGKIEEVVCLYDEDEKFVYLGTTHFSDFAIAKVEDTSSDDDKGATDGTTGSTGGTTGSTGGVTNQVAAATGDSTNMLIWVSLLVVSLGAIATVIIFAKKKNIFR